MKTIKIAGIDVNVLVEDDLVEITPEQADYLMNQNNDNFRKVSSNDVSRYAKYMKRGLWKFNGDTIGIDASGRVKDGQHRLLGCVSSGISFKTFPILIDNDTTIDNKKRMEFDAILTSLGYMNATALASTIRLIYRYENKLPNYISVMYGIDNNTLIDFFNANKDIIDSFNTTFSYARNRKGNITHSVLAGLHHIMKKIDTNLARDIVRILSLDISEYDKIGITNIDAMYHLKRILLNESNDNKLPLVVKAALFIKTWNHWRSNQTCTNLVWKCTGPTPEPFPEII